MSMFGGVIVLSPRGCFFDALHSFVGPWPWGGVLVGTFRADQWEGIQC